MHSASSKLDMQVVELYEELMTNLEKFTIQCKSGLWALWPVWPRTVILQTSKIGVHVHHKAPVIHCDVTHITLTDTPTRCSGCKFTNNPYL